MRNVPKDEVRRKYHKDHQDILDLKMGNVVEDDGVYYWEKQIDYNINLETVDKMYANNQLSREGWKETYRLSGVSLNTFIEKFSPHTPPEKVTHYYTIQLSYNEYETIQEENIEARVPIGPGSKCILFHTIEDLTDELILSLIKSDHSVDDLIIHNITELSEATFDYLRGTNTSLEYVGE